MKKTGISRREFLATLSAGTGSVLLARHVGASPKSRFASNDPFQAVKLGKSGLAASLIGSGTGSHGSQRSSNLSRLGAEKAESVIRHAYDRGVRFFDCADIYGTHGHLADALRAVPRDKYTLCSKIWFRTGALPEPERPDADVVVERFRKELDTDYIDLVQIHCMTDPDWTVTMKRQMDIMSDMKAKGIIRAHGVSVHSLEAMQAAAESDWVDVVHVRVNAFGDSMDRKDPAEVIPVIERLHQNGKGVIGMKLIGNGKYRDDPEKIEESLKYVLELGTVDMMIVGFEQEDQIDNYATRVQRAIQKMRG